MIEAGQSTARPVHETGVASQLEGEIVTSIVEAKPGEIWVATTGGGVVIADTAGGWRTRRLHYQAAVATSLLDDDFHSMYRDRGGLIWASSTMALNFHDPRPTGIATLFGVEHSDRPVTAVQVPFVLVTSDDRVWLSAGDGAGIDILDPVVGRIGELRTDPAHPRSALPAGRVLAMAAAPDGEVFIGTRQGLYTQRLRAVLRASDRLFRLGGDEFAVLLVETGDTAGSEAACIRLLQNLAEPFAYRDQTLQPGASIGTAQWSVHAPGPDALYKSADLALYDAKNAGRNTWRWCDSPARTVTASASSEHLASASSEP